MIKKTEKIILNLNLLFLILSLTLITTGCGKKKITSKKEKIQKFVVTDVKKGSVIDDKAENSYSQFMKSQFPKFHESSNTEQEEYIKLKAELSVYLMRGGNLNSWLKRRNIPKEHWMFLDSYYKLDPTVISRVKAIVNNYLAK